MRPNLYPRITSGSGGSRTFQNSKEERIAEYPFDDPAPSVYGRRVEWMGLVLCFSGYQRRRIVKIDVNAKRAPYFQKLYPYLGILMIFQPI